MTTKTTGAAAKGARQAKLTIVQPTSEPEATTTTEQPTTETPATTADLAALQAARKALDEQIKTAKANRPAKAEKPAKQAKTLADVIAAQLERPRTDLPRIITTYVLAREAAGQDRYEALDQVLAQMRSIVLGSLDSKQPGETYHQAIFRYLGRTDMLSQSADTASSDATDEQ